MALLQSTGKQRKDAKASQLSVVSLFLANVSPCCCCQIAAFGTSVTMSCLLLWWRMHRGHHVSLLLQSRLLSSPTSAASAAAVVVVGTRDASTTAAGGGLVPRQDRVLVRRRWTLLLLQAQPPQIGSASGGSCWRRTFFRDREHGYGFKIIKSSGRTSRWDVLLAGATLSAILYSFVDVRSLFERMAPDAVVRTADEYWDKGKRVVRRILRLDAAASATASIPAAATDGGDSLVVVGKDKKEKSGGGGGGGFRDRKITEYENRIRMYRSV